MVKHRQTVILRDVMQETPGGVNQEIDVDVGSAHGPSRGLRRHDKNDFVGVNAAVLARGLERQMERKGKRNPNESNLRAKLRAQRVLNKPNLLPNHVQPDKVYTSIHLGDFGMKEKYTSLDFRIAMEHLQTDRWKDPRLIHPQLKKDIIAEAHKYDDVGGCEMNTMYKRFSVYFVGKDQVETMPALGAIEKTLRAMHKHSRLHPSLSKYTQKIAQHPSAGGRMGRQSVRQASSIKGHVVVHECTL